MRFIAFTLAAFLTGCGYHVAGQSSLIPSDAHTIAVQPWGSASVHYTLSNYLNAAVTKELIARTRYRIVSDPSKADVVLSGSVANVTSGATVYDNASARTTGGQVSVQLQVKLTDRSGKVLFNQPNLEFHERYEISIDPKQYFDESEAGLQRLSKDVAATIVSDILNEQF